ncbi:MAG: cysteinyl-tRNA synthetase [Actinobacteria bacterium]|nr:cysteinyl-tRNA synthetase [Actinomycetota bacterium]
MTLPHILAVMGSGETSPTMVSTHRMLAAKLTKSSRAVLLDTPYGFQENAPELATKAVEYFQTSINLVLEVAGLTEIIAADALAVERGLQKVADADYVFAGPGSPTYALRQWSGTPLAGLLNKKLHDGGIVTFASAAALTLGKFTLPVYEIYKVGEDPRWLDGLNILGNIGVNVALIPHYNNAEGGHHDTRFCYMGERRLSMLERELPDDVYVLGVDEHTGMVIDLDAESVTVVGKGVVTIRVHGESTQIASGETFPVDRLRV